MRYRGYRRRRWHGRGILGLPFMLLFFIFLFSHSIMGIFMILPVIIIIGFILRAVLPTLFGMSNMNSNSMSNQPPYYQPQQQPQQQPYQETYQPYEQGYQYQPPVVPNQEPQYTPPPYQQTQYEEQPQAQYPQEMPPMQQ